MLYFQNQRRQGAENFYKDLLFGPLQSGVLLSGPRQHPYRQMTTGVGYWRRPITAQGFSHRKWEARPSYTPYALRACKDRALRAHKTLTLRFTDFFTYFEENPDCLAVQTHYRVYRTVLTQRCQMISALQLALRRSNLVKCLKTKRSLDSRPSTDHPSVQSDQKALSEMRRSIPRVINTSFKSSSPINSVNFSRIINKKFPTE